jgi:hypothetical protein
MVGRVVPAAYLRRQPDKRLLAHLAEEGAGFISIAAHVDLLNLIGDLLFFQLQPHLLAVRAPAGHDVQELIRQAALLPLPYTHTAPGSMNLPKQQTSRRNICSPGTSRGSHSMQSRLPIAPTWQAATCNI